MSINKQVDIVYPYHRRLLRNKREQNIDTYNRIDEPQKNYAVQKKKKKDKRMYFPWLPFMWNSKTGKTSLSWQKADQWLTGDEDDSNWLQRGMRW